MREVKEIITCIHYTCDSRFINETNNAQNPSLKMFGFEFISIGFDQIRNNYYRRTTHGSQQNGSFKFIARSFFQETNNSCAERYLYEPCHTKWVLRHMW